MKKIFIYTLMTSALFLISCKKKGCTDATATNYVLEATKDDGSCIYAEPGVEAGNVVVELKHEWETPGNPFRLDSTVIHSGTGDELNFTKLAYYISNFRLKNEDGTWWTHPESYFLVEASNSGSMLLNLNGVPVGNYTELSYIMGVDSLRNVSGAQTGALSTTHGMFWSWNSGYIMLKAEGLSPQSTSGGSFSYHLGGFSGANNIVTTKSTLFDGQTLMVQATSNPKIVLGVDPSKIFTNFGSVSTAASVHMPGANAVTLAQDFYNSGVYFKSVQN